MIRLAALMENRLPASTAPLGNAISKLSFPSRVTPLQCNPLLVSATTEEVSRWCHHRLCTLSAAVHPRYGAAIVFLEAREIKVLQPPQDNLYINYNIQPT